jgi:YD repeat-containing protein
VSHNPDGSLKETSATSAGVTLGGTDTIAYKDDALGRLKRPTTITRSGSAASTGTLTRAYTRSGATRTDGRDLSTGSDLLYENTVTYGYDALGRLTAETIGGADERAYAYDLDSNRTSRTDGGVTTTFAYDRTDQLLTQVYQGGTATSFLYDAFGNLTTKRENSATAVTAMAYADGVHMTSLTPPSGGTSTLRYDALGRTATREAGGVTTTYAYAGTSEAIWQLTTGAAVQTSLLDASGSRLSLTTAGVTRFTLFDHLGSLVGLIGPSGSLDEAYRFDGYGQELRGTTQTGKDAGARNPFRFRGAPSTSAPTASPSTRWGPGSMPPVPAPGPASTPMPARPRTPPRSTASSMSRATRRP